MEKGGERRKEKGERRKKKGQGAKKESPPHGVSTHRGGPDIY